MNSNALLLSSSLNGFQYQLLPSAFKIAESPTYLCWKSIKFSESLWNRNCANNYEQFKNRTFAVLLGISSYLGGIVALPITIGLTPLTLLADIIVGIAECIFCLYKGLAKEDLSIIAHRKFVISPCQHLTFCLGAITGLGLAWLVSISRLNLWSFKGSLLFWSMGYAFGQKAVGLLPKSLNHQSLNIFIGGGSGEGPDEQEKWLDSNINVHNQPKSNPFGQDKQLNYQIQWNNFINKEILSLNRINDANLAIQYTDFKQRLIKKCSPKDLMELSNNFNQTDLQREYRKLALIIHPDKNLPRQREAAALFNVLQKAYELLSQQ
jgi:hypothetical protein